MHISFSFYTIIPVMHACIYSPAQQSAATSLSHIILLMLKLSRVSENGNQHQLENNYHLTPKRCQMQSCTLATSMHSLLTDRKLMNENNNLKSCKQQGHSKISATSYNLQPHLRTTGKKTSLKAILINHPPMSFMSSGEKPALFENRSILF